MKIDQPSIVFSGYFKGTKEKEAELRAYTSLTDVSALSVLENEDISYIYYKKSKPKEIRYMNNVIMTKNMIRNLNIDGSITFVTITCSRTGEKKEDYRYTYSANIVIVRFDTNIRYKYDPVKIRQLCFDSVKSEYELYKNEINRFKDLGFEAIEEAASLCTNA